MYLLRLDETGTPSYVGRGDSLSRPSTLSRESIGVDTSISSILNSYFRHSLLTNPHPSPILELMSDTSTHTTETTEPKPPTIADIVREKTGDGRLIIDFFTDVMTGRIDGAELCHRIDAAKQLVKYGSKDAAEFLAKYKGVPCGHSINGRPNPADPCSAGERTLVAVTLNAPATLTRDFLTVLSGIDEFLMARLIRAQTADGGTIIDFLDDVMQDRTDGFKTHHRIAAAKELIVHIVRDEQPDPSPSTTPSPLTGEGGARPESPRRSEGDSSVVPAEAGTHPRTAAMGEPAPKQPVADTQAPNLEPNSSVVPAQSLPRTRYGAGTQGGDGGRNTVANPAHPEPSSTVIPAKSLPRTRYGAGTQRGGESRSTPANPARAEPVLSTAEGSVHPEPVEGPRPEFAEGPADSSSVVPTKEPAEGRQDYEERKPRRRRTRTQRRRDGAARAAILGRGSERNKEEQHDSTHPGRSPPW